MAANIALVIVTFVLVVITAWYALETHRMVRGMNQEREEMHRPLLTLQLVPWTGKLGQVENSKCRWRPCF